VDLILSSGFLAFARQAGFLKGVEEEGLSVDAVFGTSSGALVGALYAAGLPLTSIEQQIVAAHPPHFFRFHAYFWRGLFSLDPLVRWLSQLLPPNFSQLRYPLSVGVQSPDGSFRFISDGDLPLSVAASCAMPYIFSPIRLNGKFYRDGGAADRLGIAAWRSLRPNRTAIVHLVERTAGKDVQVDVSDLSIVRSARSGARLWSLGDVPRQIAEAHAGYRIQRKLESP
jgi:NTE family protein